MKREKGYIKKRGEGKYFVRWRIKDAVTGKTQQKSKVVKCEDYLKASDFLADQLKPPATEADIEERTFGSYMQDEWAQYVRENWKESTQVTQGSLVRRHIIPFFEDMSP